MLQQTPAFRLGYFRLGCRRCPQPEGWGLLAGVPQVSPAFRLGLVNDILFSILLHK